VLGYASKPARCQTHCVSTERMILAEGWIRVSPQAGALRAVCHRGDNERFYRRGLAKHDLESAARPEADGRLHE